MVTPFHYSTNELQSFTEATIFDVMLALVGGIAGFIGIMRREAIKVIAGVAVATACIPPLCTAGYGIATFQIKFFLGGIYFFVINCFFIGLGTWLTSTFLGYRKYYATFERRKTKVFVFMTLVGTALLLPSIWLAFQKWDKQHFEHKVTNYVEEIQQQFPELVIVNHRAFRKDNKQFADISLLNDSSDITEEVLHAANIMDTTIQVIWHFAPDKASKESARLRSEIKRLDSLLMKQDSIIQKMSFRQ